MLVRNGNVGSYCDATGTRDMARNDEQLDAHRQLLLAGLPAVHRLLAMPELAALSGAAPPTVIADAARCTLDQARKRILAGDADLQAPDAAQIAQEAAREVCRRM